MCFDHGAVSGAGGTRRCRHRLLAVCRQDPDPLQRCTSACSRVRSAHRLFHRRRRSDSFGRCAQHPAGLRSEYPHHDADQGECRSGCACLQCGRVAGRLAGCVRAKPGCAVMPESAYNTAFGTPTRTITPGFLPARSLSRISTGPRRRPDHYRRYPDWRRHGLLDSPDRDHRRRRRDGAQQRLPRSVRRPAW